ncbi:hypothetical protein JCM8097_008260 [Rhodosporidiobolus ruineniae]
MSAASYKADGNAAFAEKQYVKAIEAYSKAIDLEKDDTALGALLSNRSASYVLVQELDNALADATLAVQRRPTWSKAYARVAEVYARQQNFPASERAYTQAIKLAEDDVTKSRYSASLKTTQDAAAKVEKLAPKAEKVKIVNSTEDTLIGRLKRYVFDRGVQVPKDGGLAVTLAALENFSRGFEELEAALMQRRPDGNIYGRYHTNAVVSLVEGILLDEHAFFIGAGRDPAYPLGRKLSDLVPFELGNGGSIKYFSPATWSAEDIVDDLEKRVSTEGGSCMPAFSLFPLLLVTYPRLVLDSIRRVTAQLVRCLILRSFLFVMRHDQGAAVSDCKLALAILEVGWEKWAHLSFDDKGNLFRPTFTRVVRAWLLTKKMFSVDKVEKLALENLEKNPESDWPAFDGTTMRVSYWVMPAWEAYSALAFVYLHCNLQDPLPPGKLGFSNLVYVKKAAEYYDQAVRVMPDDTLGKPQFMWYAIQMHLFAGGLTAREAFKRVEAAEPIADKADQLLGGEDRVGPRPQVMLMIEAVADAVAAFPESQRDAAFAKILKPMPVVASESSKPNGWTHEAAMANPEWEDKVGELKVCYFV